MRGFVSIIDIRRQTARNANAALNMLENLEEINDINQMVKLLVARRS